MTPHIWRCDPSQNQTIILDKRDSDPLEVKITLTNIESSTIVQSISQRVRPLINNPLHILRFVVSGKIC